MVYVGVDLHRKRAHVVALDPAGEVVLSRRIGNAPAEFWRSFGELEPSPSRSPSRPPTAGGWSADLLADAGIAGPMAHPLATKAIAAARVKTTPWSQDPGPSAARQPAGRGLDRPTGGPPGPPTGPYPSRPGPHALPRPVPTPCPAGRPGRHPRADHPVRPGRAPLAGRAPAAGRCPRSAGCGPAADRRHHRRVTHADADLRTQFAGDPRIRRLLPIPGIGPVTAATVVAEVWEIGRFPAPERLCSWAGLTPGSAPATPPPAGATPAKQGSRWLPWMLVEAATSAVRDPHLGRFAGQIAQRRGPKITRVALARRLLTLREDALHDQDGCRAYPAPSRS